MWLKVVGVSDTLYVGRKTCLILTENQPKQGGMSSALCVRIKTCLILTRKWQNFVSKCKFSIPTNKTTRKQLVLACFGLVLKEKFSLRTILKKHNANPRKIRESSLQVLILVFKSIHHSQINDKLKIVWYGWIWSANLNKNPQHYKWIRRYTTCFMNMRSERARK